jgi:hypothetical protein
VQTHHHHDGGKRNNDPRPKPEFQNTVVLGTASGGLQRMPPASEKKEVERMTRSAALRASS